MACFCFFSVAIHASAQVGAKLSYSAPLAGFGAQFKKGVGFEVFRHSRNGGDEKLDTRLGISYAIHGPRLDSFPTFAFRNDANPIVLPGYVSYQHFSLAYAYFDFLYAAYHRKRLTIQPGIGSLFGVNRVLYRRRIVTLISETGDETRAIVGGRVMLDVAYRIGTHVELFAEGLYAHLRVPASTARFHSNNVCLGINITFKSTEDAYQDYY